MTVGNIYKKNYNKDAIAIKYKGNSITYSELDTNVNKYANLFIQMGIKKGDKVVISCLNCPEFIYTYLGVTKIGAVIVPVNLLLTLEEITYIVKNSEAKVMVIHPFILHKAKVTKEMISQALNIDVIVLDQDFEEKINNLKLAPFEEIKDENLVSTFIYTSGTTGKPKAAMLTHHNLLANCLQSFNTLKYEQNDNILCVLPMFHSFAFTVCALYPLYCGSTIVILESFQPKEIVETLIKEEITIFVGVPTMYIVLLEALKSNISFPNLRVAISGGSSLPVEVLTQVREGLKFPIIEGYGLSEASPVVTFNPYNGVQKAGSIGLPLWNVECKAVDDNGVEVPNGEVGELIVKGDNVMLGYYKDQEKTNEALKDGWLYTGDMIKQDEDGYYYIVDRKKDLIIISGFNVYPREVEEVIYSYPKVKETAVIGVKNSARGEFIKAYVVLKDGEECSRKELVKYLREKLAPYKVPRQVEFIEDLPKNGAGKILKRLLKSEQD